MEYNIKEVVYGNSTIEFVTVAVEYCIFLERFEGVTTEEFTDRLTKLLPLLYLKAQLVPEVQDLDLGDVEDAVTEEDYNFVLNRVTAVMGQYNDYLEVFVEDMQYSAEPIIAYVAENLADIYQDIRNFVAIYERGVDEHMNEALYVCMDHFKHLWGQTLVNVLRALHSVKYPSENSSMEEGDLYGTNYSEEEW